ncbi:MAG: hypothetical protein NTZ05_12730 [Chloroflexi bacterium]|nr:hypothetical protein [Chloroflexota bacterium]
MVNRLGYSFCLRRTIPLPVFDYQFLRYFYSTIVSAKTGGLRWGKGGDWALASGGICVPGVPLPPPPVGKWPVTCQQHLPVLALLAMAARYFDRLALRTPMLFRQVLEYQEFPAVMALPEQVEVIAAVTGHLPKCY